MPKQKKSKRLDKLTSYQMVVAVVCLGFYLAFGWYLVTSSYTPETKSNKVFGLGQNIQGNDYRNSLDLRVAAKAAYPSKPLEQTQYLGEFSGVKRYIVNFSVKADGLNEYGLMSLPDTTPPEKGYPVVLLLHAYMHPDSYLTDATYLDDMHFYSEAGFAVIKPDFRGQGYSRSQGSPDGANYSMAYNTDVMSLISAVKQTSYLNSKAINVFGHSMGAYVGLRASVLSPDIKVAILLAGPISDFSTMYTHYTAPSDVGNPVAAAIKAKALIKYGTPQANPNFWFYASPINFVVGSPTHYQIHVGDSDEVIPPSFSVDLDYRLSSLGKSHEYYVYEDGDHDLSGYRQLVWQRSLPFLARD